MSVNGAGVVHPWVDEVGAHRFGDRARAGIEFVEQLEAVPFRCGAVVLNGERGGVEPVVSEVVGDERRHPVVDLSRCVSCLSGDDDEYPLPLSCDVGRPGQAGSGEDPVAGDQVRLLAPLRPRPFEVARRHGNDAAAVGERADPEPGRQLLDPGVDDRPTAGAARGLGPIPSCERELAFDFVNLIWPRGDGLKWPRRGGGSMWVAVCCQAQQEVGSSLRKRFAVRRMPSAMVRYGAQVSASWVTVNPALMA